MSEPPSSVADILREINQDILDVLRLKYGRVGVLIQEGKIVTIEKLITKKK